MIKARIIARLQRYEFEVPSFAAGSLEEAYDWLQDRLYGDGEGLIELPSRFIEIAQPGQIVSLEVWEETTEAEVMANLLRQDPTPQNDEAPGEYTDQTEYLGQQLELRLITFTLRGHKYVLPQEINGQPALEQLDHSVLGHVTEAMLQRIGISATVLIPPVQLGSDQAAGEYVMDYAEQATPPAHFSPSEKTGRAARGLWNDK